MTTKGRDKEGSRGSSLALVDGHLAPQKLHPQEEEEGVLSRKESH